LTAINHHFQYYSLFGTTIPEFRQIQSFQLPISYLFYYFIYLTLNKLFNLLKIYKETYLSIVTGYFEANFTFSFSNGRRPLPRTGQGR